MYSKSILLERNDGGPDSLFSLEPSEISHHITFQDLVELTKQTIQNSKSSSERKGLSFGRSIYANKQINKGDLILTDSVSNYRPYNPNALPAHMIQGLYGKVAKYSYKAGDYILIPELL